MHISDWVVCALCGRVVCCVVRSLSFCICNTYTYTYICMCIYADNMDDDDVVRFVFRIISGVQQIMNDDREYRAS